MALIETLHGTGKLQELGIEVKYAIAVSGNPARPTKRIGEGTLESVTGAPLPALGNDQQLTLALEDGRQITIQLFGGSTKFALFGDFR